MLGRVRTVLCVLAGASVGGQQIGGFQGTRRSSDGGWHVEGFGKKKMPGSAGLAGTVAGPSASLYWSIDCGVPSCTRSNARAYTCDSFAHPSGSQPASQPRVPARAQARTRARPHEWPFLQLPLPHTTDAPPLLPRAVTMGLAPRRPPTCTHNYDRDQEHTHVRKPGRRPVCTRPTAPPQAHATGCPHARMHARTHARPHTDAARPHTDRPPARPTARTPARAGGRAGEPKP